MIIPHGGGGGEEEEVETDILQYYVDEILQTTRTSSIVSSSTSSFQQKQNQVRWMVDQLTPSQQQVAAECSFSYWKFFHHHHHHHQQERLSFSCDATVLRQACASREAARHLEGVSTKEKALELLKATLQHHMEYQTTRYRTCMTKKATTTTTTASTTNKEIEEELPQRIHNEINDNQTLLLRGFDQDGHAILFAFPRRQNLGRQVETAFVDTILYSMERACAATEYHTRGRKEKVVVVIDTTQGSVSPPSIHAAKQCVQILQNYYPERLYKLLVWNPPLVLYTLYQCIKPFLDPATAAKFIFCKGDRQIRETMSQLLHNHNNNNNNSNNNNVSSQFWDMSQIDCHRYLYDIPFHLSYHTDTDTSIRTIPKSQSTTTVGNDRCISYRDSTTISSSLLSSSLSSQNGTSTIPVYTRTLAVGELQQRQQQQHQTKNRHGGEEKVDETDQVQYQVVKLTTVIA
jgi:hypothetical protein